MWNNIALYIEGLSRKKSVHVTLWALLAGYFLLSFRTLTIIPLQSLDESWFSEQSYYLLKHGVLNSNMFLGLREFIGGSVGHGFIYFFIEAVSFYFFGTGLFQARLPVFIASFVILLLIYLIAEKLYNKRTAFISLLIAALSPLFFRSSHPFEAHIFLLLFLLVCLYLYLLDMKEVGSSIKPLLIGIVSCASLEIHWIGSIIPTVMLVLYVREYKTAIFRNKQLYLFLLGCCISFAFIIYYRIYVLGLDLFLYKFNLYYNIAKASSYPVSLLEEINRYKKYFSSALRWFEVIPIIAAVGYVLKRKSKSDSFLMLIAALYVFFMALVVKNKNPYFIVFAPLLYIVMASVIDDLLSNIKQLKILSRIVLLCVSLMVPYSIFYDLSVSWKYRNADYNQFIQKIRKNIPDNSIVMGPMALWYGFYDMLYMDNLFYLDRALETGKGGIDIKGDPDYVYKQKNEMLMDFLKLRKVQYFIVDEHAKKFLELNHYQMLDGKDEHFRLLEEIKDPFYLTYNPHKTNRLYVTDVYKVVLQ